MITIGVTGADGLIGFHARCFLHGIPGVTLRTANRATFADPAALAEFAGPCDAILHLAGINRAADDEIARGNPALAEAIVGALETSGARPHVLFSSSIQAERDNVYGRSKRAATDILRRWAERSGGRFTNLILPHVFGEFGKPFYNSVVSTFCHQLAHGEEPRIVTDGELELLHAQQVAEAAWQVVGQPQQPEVRLRGVPLRVSELLACLRTMFQQYDAMVIPDLREPLCLLLFNTLRSYMFPARYPVPLRLHSDARGSLFEAVKSQNGGQTFVSTTLPGVTRGNHYHLRKVERFLVIGGAATIRLRKLFSTEVREFPVSGDEPRFIDIPTMHTHNITNTGSGPLTTLFWAHEIFDPARPDTVAEVV